MANEYLKRTPTSTGNRRVWTASLWYKMSSAGGFFGAGDGSNAANSSHWWFNSDQLGYSNNDGTNYATVLRKSRDFSSWSHYMLVVDTTKVEPYDRVVFYENGVRNEVDTTSGYTNPSRNAELSWINQLYAHHIGARNRAGANTFSTGEYCDFFFVDGQALTPDVFGFYKQGKGYISVGSTQATDFRPGQWVPKTPRVIKTEINRRGGFGVNGFYLPMNDSSNFGADFHTTPNSIITLKGENLPQPRNGAPTTTDAYVSQLRTDPYAANLVLAVPGISTSTSANIITNGNFDSNISGWTTVQATTSWQSGVLRIIPNASVNGGVYQSITTEVGKRYTVSIEVVAAAAANARLHIGTSTDINSADKYTYTSGSLNNIGVGKYTISFTPSTTTTIIWLEVGGGVQTQIDFDNIVVKQEDAPRDYSADIKDSGTNKTLTAYENAGVGYEIPSYYGSALSFPGTSGDYLATPSDSDFAFGTGDFTVEFWVKANTVNTYHQIFDTRGTVANSTTGFSFGYTSGNYYIYTNTFNIQTSTVLNEFVHLAVERDGSKLTLYKNGVSAGIQTNFNLNLTNSTIYVGATGTSDTNQYFKGQLQDLRVYKGVAKYKGGFDVPKPYTPVGIATWRAVPDTTANNFATLNRTSIPSKYTVSNGNLTFTNSTSNWTGWLEGTVGFSTGKYYWETRIDVSTDYHHIGIVGVGITHFTTIDTYRYGVSYQADGRYWAENNNLTAFQTGITQSKTVGDIVQVAVDMSNKRMWIGKNGTWFAGDPATGSSPPFDSTRGFNYVHYVPFYDSYGSSGLSINFGQNPTFSGNTTAGTFTDSNGKGLFKYQPPSGFLALCEDNLPTPAISDPGKHFKTVLYTGDGNSGRSIVGVGFTPDLVWVKNRSNAASHIINDSVRGAGFNLFSNSTAAENGSGGVGGDLFQSFNSDGFAINPTYAGSSNNGTNASGQTYAAWCWRAGAGTTSTNTNGSITSVVSVNQDAGFSIVSYRGTGVNATVGHGLGKAPSFMVFKQRNQSDGWLIYHKSITARNFLQWDTDASAPLSTAFNNTEPTSSVFSLGSLTNTNDSGWPIIAYCWAEIEGFSKFGSYVGNGNADGSMVWCGFKPACVITKRTDSTGGWQILDSSRMSINSSNTPTLFPNTSGIELGTDVMDFLSNGFKFRSTGTDYNASSGTYIFAAFAESPFTTANAK